MKKLTPFFILSFLFIVFISLAPDLALASDPNAGASGGFVECSGGDCSFCHLVDLGSNVLNWLFGLVFVLFGVVAFVAGFGLVTSGGSQDKLDKAKEKLSNAVIGLIIVFSAWLIVDTLLKAVLPGGNTSIGPWNSISCGTGNPSPQTGSGLPTTSPSPGNTTPQNNPPPSAQPPSQNPNTVRRFTNWINPLNNTSGVRNFVGSRNDCINDFTAFAQANPGVSAFNGISCTPELGQGGP